MSQAMESVKENKMGVMPVKKLIVNMSVPMMISMLVQALYNIVDSISLHRSAKMHWPQSRLHFLCRIL